MARPEGLFEQDERLRLLALQDQRLEIIRGNIKFNKECEVIVKVDKTTSGPDKIQKLNGQFISEYENHFLFQHHYGCNESFRKFDIENCKIKYKKTKGVSGYEGYKKTRSS